MTFLEESKLPFFQKSGGIYPPPYTTVVPPLGKALSVNYISDISYLQQHLSCNRSLKLFNNMNTTCKIEEKYSIFIMMVSLTTKQLDFHYTQRCIQDFSSWGF